MSDSDHEASDGAGAGKHRTYDVGYGKPPLSTRFVEGASGNPKGRKPGAKNLVTLLIRELNTKVAVTEKNKRKLKSKCEVSVAQLVNKAANGDLNAFARIATMLEKYEANERTAQSETPAGNPVAATDAQVLADYLRRLGESTPDDE